MSQVFTVGDEVVWSPALRVGDLYVRFLGELADVVGLPTGLDAVASDYHEIDVETFGALVRQIADLRLRSRHPVLRGLVDGVLGPSVVVLERAGRPLVPRSDEERAFLDAARTLSMAR